MLTYHIPEHLDIPLYQFLYQNIKTDIENNILKAHDKLPSKRSLSKHLKISVMTVENAYNQLLLEGYIYAKERQGYYVDEIEFHHYKHNITHPIIQDISQTYTIDLKTNTVSAHYFPFTSWSKLSRKVLSEYSDALLIKSHPQGSLELREAICEHLYAYSHIKIHPEQIVIGCGSEYLYGLVVQLLGHNHLYALEDPGYKTISKIYDVHSIQYEYIPMDKDGLSIDSLYHSSCDILHISCAHHFPTGITTSIKKRMELIKWVNEKNGYIIEDDYDSEFRLQGHPLSSLFQLDQGRHVIYMNTFSKTLSPSFRMSYMVLPYPLVSLYKEKLGFYSCPVSHLEQLTLAKFIKHGYFEKHINRMRHYYKTLRNELLKEIYSLPIDIKIKEENAGLHFLLTYHSSKSDKEVLDIARSYSLNISCLSSYYENYFDSHTFVVNYSGLCIDDIKEAVNLLYKVLTKIS